MVTIIGKLLEGLNYAIKTAVNISEQKYSHLEESVVFCAEYDSVQSMYAWGMINFLSC